MNNNHWIKDVGTTAYLQCDKKPRLLLIAGPCVIEDRNFILDVTHQIHEICQNKNIAWVFKASYDKANRTSHESFRGVGLHHGLEILDEVKQKFSIPVTSDVHSLEEVKPAAEVLDIIQIPAFLSRQTDLIQESARTGRIINIKKGQFLSPWDMEPTVRKTKSVGNERVLLTERGTFFGYQNLVNDFRCLSIMRQFAPVLFDITHSVQAPGGLGNASGGERKYIPMLAHAAVASGVYGIFMETHPHPKQAKSDAKTQFPLDLLEPLVDEMIALFELRSSFTENWEQKLLEYD